MPATITVAIFAKIDQVDQQLLAWMTNETAQLPGSCGSPHPSSQCRDHRISLILAVEACAPPAQRANEKLTLPRVYEKGASHYWVQPFLVSPSSTCFKYFRCYTRLVAISQSSFTPDEVPIVCPLDYGLLFLIGCSLIGYTEFER
ncbi:conserved hypothetical protein [Trichinella spiralis]|uniref:hypothetical protein n=1 Tax=Trichinella spiralis TaxID=6334 RepID=UPI0001EFE12E|nr:conserved hypothetical protein [Trichinella spiralis]